MSPASDFRNPTLLESSHAVIAKQLCTGVLEHFGEVDARKGVAYLESEIAAQRREIAEFENSRGHWDTVASNFEMACMTATTASTLRKVLQDEVDAGAINETDHGDELCNRFARIQALTSALTDAMERFDEQFPEATR